MKPILLCTLILASQLASAATLQSMTKHQVEEAFVNKTNKSIPADNLNGVDIANSFKVYLDGQGNIYAKFSEKPKKEPQSDTGTYKIAEDGTMRITWKHWDGASEVCAQFFETKNTVIAIDCGNVFHTAFMKANMESGKKL